MQNDVSDLAYNQEPMKNHLFSLLQTFNKATWFMIELRQIQRIIRSSELGSDVSKVISEIKNLGADINSDFDGRSIIGIAVEYGKANLVEALLDQGVDANRWDEELTACPLGIACESGSIELVRSLLSGGANPNLQPPPGGSPPLCEAAGMRSRLPIMQLLLDTGADVNLCARNFENELSGSPLSIACHMGNIEAVRTLLRCNADPNLVFPSGTALSVAVQEGQFEIVKLLLEHGADPSLRYSEESGFPLGNKTPLEIAHIKKNSAIIKLFESKPTREIASSPEPLDFWLNKQVNEPSIVFNQSATNLELTEFEKGLGAMPIPLSTIFRFANGESLESNGLFAHPGDGDFERRFSLLSLQAAMRETMELASVEGRQYERILIAFAANGLGDYLCYCRDNNSSDFDVRLFEHENGTSRFIGCFNEWLQREIDKSEMR